MALCETPDGQEVNDGDYLIIRDDAGNICFAHQFEEKGGIIEHEPLSSKSDIGPGDFQKDSPDYLMDQLVNKYPPAIHDYDVRSSLTDKLISKLEL